MLKRYWLFGGHEYYPAGGMFDFLAADNDLAVLKARLGVDEKTSNAFVELPGGKRSLLDWAHILDTEDQRIVAQASRDGVWAEPDEDIWRHSQMPITSSTDAPPSRN